MAKKKTAVKNQDYVLLVVTLLFGVFGGWYMYIVVFAPHFNKLEGQTEAVYEDLVLVGEQYGGMRPNSAPSFQILKDGSYNYVTYTVEAETAVHRAGTLPTDLWREVKNDMTRAKLESLSRPVTDIACASASDGIDYRYDITLNSVKYGLNSCTTALGHSPTVILTLDKLWTYFETHQ